MPTSQNSRDYWTNLINANMSQTESRVLTGTPRDLGIMCLHDYHLNLERLSLKRNSDENSHHFSKQLGINSTISSFNPLHFHWNIAGLDCGFGVSGEIGASAPRLHCSSVDELEVFVGFWWLMQLDQFFSGWKPKERNYEFPNWGFEIPTHTWWRGRARRAGKIREKKFRTWKKLEFSTLNLPSKHGVEEIPYCLFAKVTDIFIDNQILCQILYWIF